MNNKKLKKSKFAYAHNEFKELGDFVPFRVRIMSFFCLLFRLSPTGMNQIERLMDRMPLSPIYNKRRDWILVHTNHSGYKRYMHKRYNSLLKEVSPKGNEFFRDVGRFMLHAPEPTDMVVENLYEHTLLGIMCRMYPVTFPYYPEMDCYHVYYESFIMKHEDESDFMSRYVKPTKYVLIKQVVTPHYDMIDIYRCFRIFAQNTYEEISVDEYYEIRGECND